MDKKSSPGPAPQVRLENLLESKDYFGLRDAYTELRGRLDAKQALYWDAIYYNLFGREYLSLRAAGKYRTLYGDGDEGSAEMLYVSAVNRLRRHRYRSAAADYRRLLRLHGSSLPAEELEEARNNLSVCRALRDVPPQRVERGGITSFPVKKTRLGHLTAKVVSESAAGDFIVDTGANFSAVSQSAAREMGLRPVAGDIEVGTATGVRIGCALAWAPRLEMGGIVVRNAVFIVMEDPQLDFSSIGYTIEGIIGLPVLRQLGDLKITPHEIRIGNVRIPAGARNNICLEGLMPLVRVHSRGQALTFTLDTGANRSEYSYGYYSAHREKIDARAGRQKGLRGGGGGVVRHNALVLNDETLTVAGRRLTVAEISVILDDYEFSRGKDGNLGLDSLLVGGGFALSFRRMALYPAAARKRKVPAKG